MPVKSPTKQNVGERFFVFLKALVSDLESSAIDLVSATTPWLAPVIPASQTYLHAINSLRYSESIAFVAALAVEFLGLAAVSTAVEFWNYNDTLKARKEARVHLLKGEDKKRARERRVVGAPFQLAAASGVFYIAIILTVNILLDWGKPFPQVAANVLLSLLAVPAAVIIAIRSQHRRKLTETRRARSGATQVEQGAKKTRTVANDNYDDANRSRQDESSIAAIATGARTVTRDEFVTVFKSNGHHSIAELARELGVNPRTAQKWIKGAE
jgi:hypothetical protein